MSLQVKLAQPVRQVGTFAAMWPVCPDGGSHFAQRVLDEDTTELPDLWSPDASDWDGACIRCGEEIPWGAMRDCCGDQDCDEIVPVVSRSAGRTTIWDTPSGQLEPGDMYWGEQHGPYGCYHWDNCDGRHLHVLLPNNFPWDIDSRASNCNLPDDRQHRCWVREGEPPNITVGKAGLTCSAGAGSIASGTYHGFLRNGVFTDC